MAVDNQTVPTPLAILAHKTIPSDTGPRQLVLVQWRGLHPDETSWEDWTNLKNIHHLEDKVLFEARGNDTNSSKELQTARPKRQSHTPSHLKDYVLNT